jgi:peptidoglycan hydrolase-like protein with peptidoglycan-binding domain
MKRTLLTLGLSAMLAMPMLAVAQSAPMTPGASGETGYGRSGSGTAMEHHGQQAMGAEQVRMAQKQLKEAGFNPGPIDGQIGRQTSQAIREYQKDNGLPQTGQLDEPTKDLLMAESTQPSSERLDSLPGSTPGRSMGDEPSGSGRNPGTLGGSGSSR